MFPIDRTRPPSRILYEDGIRHLQLRPWCVADAGALMATAEASDAELRKFMPWAHGPRTQESQYEVVAKFQADYWAGRDLVLGMFSKAGEILGCIGVHARTALNPQALEIGYWCHSAHAGKGWTTLAVRMMAVLVFDRFACDRLQVMHDETNVASRRVVEKCGFVYEGTMRNATASVPEAMRTGGYVGTARQRLYALTPDDLPTLDWLAAVRRQMTYHDALGGVHPAVTGAAPSSKPG